MDDQLLGFAVKRQPVCIGGGNNDGFVRIVGEDDILCFVLDDLVFCTFELAENDAILVNDRLSSGLTRLHVQDGVAAFQAIVRIRNDVNLVAIEGQMAPVCLVCRDLELTGSGHHFNVAFSANGLKGDVGAGRYGDQLRNGHVIAFLPAGKHGQNRCQ